MNKICTSLEQSKKLIELGIDINTADMLWTYDFVVNDINGLNVISDHFKPEENDVPAWSLDALLKILKNYQLFSNGLIVYIDNESYKIDSDNPIDAVFEMILKLHELKLL